MNVVDYLFENVKSSKKEFLYGLPESITMGDLYARVERTAKNIVKTFGVGKEIILISENSVFFLVSYFAIMRSGNQAMLVETRITEMELDDLMRRCNPVAILVQEKLRKKLERYPNHEILMEKDLEEFDKPSSTDLPKTKDDDVCDIIFTSGSSGTKKGVMLTHKNIRANTESILEYLQLTENDRQMAVLPFYYCFGASLLHTHLRIGGSMAFDTSPFLGGAVRAIEKYECTGLSGVPATYQILISKTDFLKLEMPSLRYMTQAGGKLENKFIKQIAETFLNKKFIVMYGATEATARLSYLPPELVWKKLGSIGKGIPGVRLEVHDENGKPVKPGDTGEIAAKGDNIMVGYYKDPEGTKAALKNGWYYTGDLATVDEDGFIFVVGRSKDILKSAGYRISPYEIEQLICTNEKVAACAVVGLPDDLMGEAVTAVIELVPGQGQEEVQREVEELCKKKLPSYKLPRQIVFIKQFPLNSSTKIDKPKVREMLMKKESD
jgi:acyl-CoA synthetase (AMP-forming)/AMP-acid ligase II